MPPRPRSTMLPARAASCSRGAAGAAGWPARLACASTPDDRGTRLVHNRHRGPLRLLKALRQRRRSAARGGASSILPADSSAATRLAIDLELGSRCAGARDHARASRSGTAAKTVGIRAHPHRVARPRPASNGCRSRRSSSTARMPGRRWRSTSTRTPPASAGRCWSGAGPPWASASVTGHVDQTLSISVGAAVAVAGAPACRRRRPPVRLAARLGRKADRGQRLVLRAGAGCRSACGTCGTAGVRSAPAISRRQPGEAAAAAPRAAAGPAHRAAAPPSPPTVCCSPSCWPTTASS